MQTYTAQLFLFIYFICRLETVCSCDAGWVSFGNSCYKYVAYTATWNNARTSCLNMGADLLVIKNQEENDFLYNNYFGTTLWLGLTDQKNENDFIWVDSGGKCSNYTNYSPGEPNDAGYKEDCIALDFPNADTWNDVPCYRYYSYVCEKYFFQDTTPPSYGSSCPYDTHVLSSQPERLVSVYWTPPTWTDDSLCHIIETTSSYSSGHVIKIPDGVLGAFINVTYTATDMAGNWKTCQFRITASCVQSDNQCLNGGTMEISNGTTISCTCAPGFSGLYCEIDDICLSNPCKNNGTCALYPSMRGYMCFCNEGYSGQSCQEYHDSKYRCLNGGTLFKSNGTTYCSCASGFSGVACEFNICLSNPCKNNGTCALYSSMRGYMCFCSEGYSGQSCQDYNDENYSDSQYRCLNGGTLVKSNGTTSYCSCVSGFSGVACEFNNMSSSNPSKFNESCALYPHKGTDGSDDRGYYLIAVVICLTIIILIMTVVLVKLLRRNRIMKAEYQVDIDMDMDAVGGAKPSLIQAEKHDYTRETPTTILL